MLLIPDQFPIDLWRTATKTKPIVAKHVSAVIGDDTMLAKLLVDTLEGKEPISQGNMFCIGGAGDTWQQTPAKLLKKYTIEGIDSNGWLYCVPRPENEVWAVQISDEFVRVYGSAIDPNFHIIGMWGETLDDGTQNVQRGVVGDVVCRQKGDDTDTWIVRRSLFDNTYSFKD